MTDHPTPDAPQQRLKDALDGQHVAMLTTIDGNGRLHSKPMFLLDLDERGHLWFFTRARPDDSNPSRHYRIANLAFSHSGSSRYVSVSCEGDVLRDRNRIRALWTTMAKPWFPDGPDSPDLVCLRFVPLQAEVWDGPGNGLSQALAIAASIVAGKPVGLGEHQVISGLGTPSTV